MFVSPGATLVFTESLRPSYPSKVRRVPLVVLVAVGVATVIAPASRARADPPPASTVTPYANTDPSDDDVLGPPDELPDCDAQLAAAGVTFRHASLPVHAEHKLVCGAPQVVVYLRGPGNIAYDPAPLLTCSMALALASFERIVQDEAARDFRVPVVRIAQLGTYNCREMAAYPGWVSEHCLRERDRPRALHAAQRRHGGRAARLRQGRGAAARRRRVPARRVAAGVRRERVLARAHAVLRRHTTRTTSTWTWRATAATARAPGPTSRARARRRQTARSPRAAPATDRRCTAATSRTRSTRSSGPPACTASQRAGAAAGSRGPGRRTTSCTCRRPAPAAARPEEVPAVALAQRVVARQAPPSSTSRRRRSRRPAKRGSPRDSGPWGSSRRDRRRCPSNRSCTA